MSGHLLKIVALAGLLALNGRAALGQPPQPAPGPAISASAMALPLAASWNVGQRPGGLTPAVQVREIEAGHHILLTFALPLPGQALDDAARAYYEAPIKRAAALRLPLAFTSTQWEARLSGDPKYFALPAEQNPNVVTRSGEIQKKVSPFGPVPPWREAGAEWGGSAILKTLQTWYPDPPSVTFISNNEHAKLAWSALSEDARLIPAVPATASDDQRKALVGEAWRIRYRALQRGFREALTAPGWRDRAKFVGYAAFGPAFMGRWGGWTQYVLSADPRLGPETTWDGASASYYVNDWDGSTDYTVWCPQIEAMNWVPMLAEVKRINPDFWFELSTWDGNAVGNPGERRAYYAERGQHYSPQRYEGMVQFGMWLLRPVSVRDYRGWTETLDKMGGYFFAVVAAVDRVYASTILTKFWQEGTLAPNTTAQHPYQANVPEAMRGVNRWFLLDTSVMPAPPLRLDTEFRVYALARVIGAKPHRYWLIYAHAPRGPEKDITVSIPDFAQIKINVSEAGSFYLVQEHSGQVCAIGGDGENRPCGDKVSWTE